MDEALVFTRTKHRANRLQAFLVRQGIKAERIHGNRSQAQRTEALAGFKSGKYRVLVATDIAARGIDVEALGHVVNFDVPMVPEDYIHRVGRTARAEATGDAFTFVAPDEEGELRGIERAIGRRLPRVTVPDFDYQAQARDQARGAAGRADRRRSAPRRRRTGSAPKPRRHGARPIRRRSRGGPSPRRVQWTECQGGEVAPAAAGGPAAGGLLGGGREVGGPDRGGRAGTRGRHLNSRRGHARKRAPFVLRGSA